MAAVTLLDHQERWSSGRWDNASTDTTVWHSRDGLSGAIPSSYDHLLIIGSIRGEAANSYWNNLWIRVGNGSLSTGAYYSSTYLTNVNQGAPITGRATGQTKWAYQYSGANQILGDTFSTLKIWIPNYSTTGGFKQALIQTAVVNDDTNNAHSNLTLTSGLWHSTSVITDVAVSEPGSGFNTYTDFSLYGITGA